MRIAPRAAALAVLLTSGAAAAAPSADPTLEQRVQSELGERDPEGVKVFHAALAAGDKGDLDKMATLLGQVHEHDPWFVPATRRLCIAELARDHTVLALSLCEEAYRKEPTPIDGAALATALLAAEGSKPASVSRALALAKDAAQRSPDEYPCELALCETALRAGDVASLDGCSAALTRLAPGEASTFFFVALDDAYRGKLPEARAALDQGKAAGLSPPQVGAAAAAIDHATSPWRKYGPRVGMAVGLWLGGLAALALLAAVLGSMARAAPGGAALRLYRAAVRAVSAWAYASVPLSLAALLAGLVALYELTFATRQLTTRAFGFGVLFDASMVAIAAASLRTAVGPREPGVLLPLHENPDLRDELARLAKATRGRKVGAAYAARGGEVVVADRGSAGLSPPWRRGERIAVLGVERLDGPGADLRRALAAEMARLREADALGLGPALAARDSAPSLVRQMLQAMGVANVVNPAFWLAAYAAAVVKIATAPAARLARSLPVADPELGPPAPEGETGWSLVAKRAAVEPRLGRPADR